MTFGWCGCCQSRRRRRPPPNNNNNDSDDDDEERAAYYMNSRRQREQRIADQSKQRQEFLDNVLWTKIAIAGKFTDNEDDFFPLEQEEEEETANTTTTAVEGGAGNADNGISCTICLVEYDEGDKISFSHNPKCSHHFHKECAMEWLKDHDECPCCRCNYLAFSDDGQDDDNGGARNNGPVAAPEDALMEGPALFLARLFQTGPFDAQPSSSSSPEVNEAWRLASRDDGWEDRLDRWRTQVQERVQIAQQRLEEQQQRRRHENINDDNNNNNSNNTIPMEERVERSLERARSQFSFLGQQVLDRERRENAIRSVRTRLQDVANSESARHLREQSLQTLQNFSRQASMRR